MQLQTRRLPSQLRTAFETTGYFCRSTTVFQHFTTVTPRDVFKEHFQLCFCQQDQVFLTRPQIISSCVCSDQNRQRNQVSPHCNHCCLKIQLKAEPEVKPGKSFFFFALSIYHLSYVTVGMQLKVNFIIDWSAK